MIGNHISAHAYACVYRVNDTQFIPTKCVMHTMHVRTHMRMHHKTVSRIVMYPLPSQYDTHPYAHTLTLLFSPANSPPRTPYAFKERSCSGRHQTGTAVCRIPLLQTVFPGRTHARKNKTHGSLWESSSGDKCRRNQREPMQHWRIPARTRKVRRNLAYFQPVFENTLQPVHNPIVNWVTLHLQTED